MCLYPKLVKNRKYCATKKNGGVIPKHTDDRVLMIPVGCGKCMECMKQKANGWRTRLLEEVRNDNTGKFVTLSFSDESLNRLGKDKNIKYLEGYEQDNAIAKKALRKFLETWRKKTGKSVKHWCVTELGGNYTERIHIHGILFTNDIQLIKEKWQERTVKGKKVGFGNVWIGDYVNESTIHYIVKYLHKVDVKHKEYKSIVLTSAGIGKKYLDRNDSKRNAFNGDKTIQTYKTKEGKTIGIPKYYRNKLYTEEEREELWLQLLDEQVRWVDGVKIDVSQDTTDYEKVRNEARKKNKRLGFGNDEKDWDKIRYENSQRKLGQRIKKEERVEEKNLPERSDSVWDRATRPPNGSNT